MISVGYGLPNSEGPRHRLLIYFRFIKLILAVILLVSWQCILDFLLEWIIMFIRILSIKWSLLVILLHLRVLNIRILSWSYSLLLLIIYFFANLLQGWLRRLLSCEILLWLVNYVAYIIGIIKLCLSIIITFFILLILQRTWWWDWMVFRFMSRWRNNLLNIFISHICSSCWSWSSILLHANGSHARQLFILALIISVLIIFIGCFRNLAIAIRTSLTNFIAIHLLLQRCNHIFSIIQLWNHRTVVFNHLYIVIWQRWWQGIL